jgi:hypothetical protein
VFFCFTQLYICYLIIFFLFNFIYFISICPTIRLVLGDGSDEAPFCVSMTSMMLLSSVNKVSMWELPVVLHMDGTFKLNEKEFPVKSLGVSDGAQQLHIMSLSIISHHTEDM